MPTNLLLLPLLGGYWFLHTFYYTRFRSQRLDGYRLLLESAIVGFLLLALARVAVVVISACPCFQNIWLTVAPRDIPHLGAAFLSFLFGFTLPLSINSALSRTGLMTRADAQRKAIDRHGNHILRLLHAASAEERMVAITLDSRKVYIGTVAAAPNLETHDTFLSITPFFSGYRDKNHLGLVLTVDYLSVYERQHLDPEDFNVTVPVASVRMASFFDQTIYPAFNVESSSDPESGNMPDPNLATLSLDESS